MKIPLESASGWRCIENIPGSNLCYIAYRINGISQYKKYLITADERYKQYDLVITKMMCISWEV